MTEPDSDAPEAGPNELLRLVRSIKRKRTRPQFESDSDDYTSPLHHISNRGHKLQANGEGLNRNCLSLKNTTFGLETVASARGRRTVITKRGRVKVHPASDSESEPYSSIALEHILAPIYHPSDVVHHPAFSKTFRSQVTLNLAQQTIEIIEKEQDTVIQLMKLMNVFLGDDADSILAANIDLPEYDHHLTSNVTKEEQDMSGKFEERRITRQQLHDEEDPFFALPRLVADVNFGIDAESAEETRQLTQIALQRSEEYIRCMTALRLGLIRSDRLKGQLFRWCKEMGGETE